MRRGQKLLNHGCHYCHRRFGTEHGLRIHMYRAHPSQTDHPTLTGGPSSAQPAVPETAPTVPYHEVHQPEPNKTLDLIRRVKALAAEVGGLHELAELAEELS